LVLAFNDLKAADATPDRHADASRVPGMNVKPARGDRH
jgi:hypothetical protein